MKLQPLIIDNDFHKNDDISNKMSTDVDIKANSNEECQSAPNASRIGMKVVFPPKEFDGICCRSMFTLLHFTLLLYLYLMKWKHYRPTRLIVINLDFSSLCRQS